MRWKWVVPGRLQTCPTFPKLLAFRKVTIKPPRVPPVTGQVLNFCHLRFEFVSDFVLRISNFCPCFGF